MFPAVFKFGLLFAARLAPEVSLNNLRPERVEVGAVRGGKEERPAVPGRGRGASGAPVWPGAVLTPGSLCLSGLVPEPSGEVAQTREGGRANPSSGTALPGAALSHPPAQPLPGRQPLPPAPPCTRLGLDSSCCRCCRCLPEPTSASRLSQPAAQRGAAGSEHFPRSRGVPAPSLHQPCIRQVTCGLGKSVCLSHTHSLESGRRPGTGKGYTHLFSLA